MEALELLWARSQALEDGLVKRYPDGYLKEHGPEAPRGAYPHLFVQLHLLFGQALLVPGVFLLQFQELGLHSGHGSGGAELLQSERQQYQADEDREEDDGDAEVLEEEIA